MKTLVRWLLLSWLLGIGLSLSIAWSDEKSKPSRSPCAELLAQFARGSKPRSKDPAEIAAAQRRALLRDVVGVARQAEVLDSVKERSRSKLVPLKEVPKILERPVRGFQALDRLRALSEKPWRKPPDIKPLRDALDELGRHSDRAGVRLIQADLADKLFLEGHPEQARNLFPEDLTAEEAAVQLRNLKKLIDKGQPAGWTASQVAAAEYGGPGSPRAPPGLLLLVPMGEPGGTRSPILESALADLPPLEPPPPGGRKPSPALGEAVAEQFRQQLDTGLQEARRQLKTTARQVQTKVSRAQKPADDRPGAVKEDDETEEDRVYIAAIERQVGKLNQAERFLACQLRREKVSVADAVVVFRRLRSAR